MRLDQSEVRRKVLPKCSVCRKPHKRLKQRYCLACSAAYNRKWRKTHPLTKAQKVKDNARSYAAAYQRRGILRRRPCQKCGDGNSEKHHPDYSRPLHVIWLCRRCHIDLHQRPDPALEQRLEADAQIVIQRRGPSTKKLWRGKKRVLVPGKNRGNPPRETISRHEAKATV